MHLSPTAGPIAWPAARQKIEAFFPDEWQRGQVLGLDSSLLIRKDQCAKINALHGLSDDIIRATLRCLAGINSGNACR